QLLLYHRAIFPLFARQIALALLNLEGFVKELSARLPASGKSRRIFRRQQGRRGLGFLPQRERGTIGASLLEKPSLPLAASGFAPGAAAAIPTIFSATPAAESAGLLPFLIPAIMLALFATTGFASLRACDRARKILAETYDRSAETAGCLALLLSPSGRVSSVSPNCECLFGLDARELTERPFFDRLHFAHRPP